jgi:methionyl-tRNA formyltransferase
LHYIDAGEDTGDIVYQRTYHIPLGIKSPMMQDLAIGQLGCELVLEALKQIGRGNNLPRQTQPTQSSTARARNIKSSEHGTLIDWTNWSIERIWHLMRGTELWLDCVESPGGVYSGQRWVVDDFERINGFVNDHLLGQVKQDENGYYVQCREGIIRLHVDLDFYAFLRIILKKFLK